MVDQLTADWLTSKGVPDACRRIVAEVGGATGRASAVGGDTDRSVPARLWLAGIALLVGVATVAGQGGPRTERHGPAPLVTSAESTDWPLHNRDLQNSRYAPIAQIDTTNVATLEVGSRSVCRE